MEHDLGDGVIALLAALADNVDRHAGAAGHSQRVAACTSVVLDALGIGGPEARTIVVAAHLHDLGKFGLPQQHLIHPGPLSSEGLALVRSHPQRGADYLAHRPGMAAVGELVLAHHECPDGGGYPRGLRGEAIPLGARIIAVADSFDAMTSDRPYRRSMLLATAMIILSQGAGKQWDRSIVATFLSEVVPVLLERGHMAGGPADAAMGGEEPASGHAVA